jgi:hypothetical protein
MRIIQLRDYLDALIAAGVDPNLPVCIHGDDAAQEASEVCDADLYVGHYREDPSPKICGFLDTNGRFLLLQTNIDYDAMLSGTPPRYLRVESGVESPAKSWPNGHWHSEPRPTEL